MRKNTDVQTQGLIDMINILSSWLDEGIPPGGLVRLWRIVPGDQIETFDVSHEVSFNFLGACINHWVADIKKELNAGEKVVLNA